jgi:hypothetical protein
MVPGLALSTQRGDGAQFHQDRAQVPLLVRCQARASWSMPGARVFMATVAPLVNLGLSVLEPPDVSAQLSPCHPASALPLVRACVLRLGCLTGLGDR